MTHFLHISLKGSVDSHKATPANSATHHELMGASCIQTTTKLNKTQLLCYNIHFSNILELNLIILSTIAQILSISLLFTGESYFALFKVLGKNASHVYLVLNRGQNNFVFVYVVFKVLCVFCIRERKVTFLEQQ